MTDAENVLASEGKGKSDDLVDLGNRSGIPIQMINNAVDKEKRVFRIKCQLSEKFEPVPQNPGLTYNSKKVTGMVGLENLGATCYLNALLQMLYHVNAFRMAVYRLPHEDEVFGSSTTLALQSVFRNLQCATTTVTTKDLTNAFGWTSQEAFMQQDVQEMMRVLLDKLEDKMKGTDVEGEVARLFSGTVRSYIRCTEVDYESKREENFYDIQVGN